MKFTTAAIPSLIQPAGHGEDLPSPAGHERGPGAAEPQHPPGFQPALQEEGREAAHAADIPAQQDEGEHAGIHFDHPNLARAKERN